MSISAAALLTLLFNPAAYACDLDDCTLPVQLHAVTVADEAPPTDRWAWMNHDLALARDALAHGHRARALLIVRDVDRSMRSGFDALIAARGVDGVLAMHASLQRVAQKAGGWPLDELPLRNRAQPRRS